MHAHTWTARAYLYELNLEKALLRDIFRELETLKERIDAAEDFEDLERVQQALRKLWNTYKDVVDVEAFERGA